MSDPGLGREEAEAAERQRQRRRTWPSLVFTAAIVAFWTAVLSAIAGLGAASLTEPSERLSSVLGFGAVVAAVLTAIGWVAQRIYLTVRRSPIRDARNLGVIAGAALLALAPAAFIARSDAVHRQVNREPAGYQAYVIDDEYSLGLYDADADANLALHEALGRDGLLQTHLRDRSSLPDLRARLTRARAALDLHEEKVASLQQDALDRIRRADMADWEREQWLARFNDGFADTRPVFEQRYVLHRRAFDLQEQQIEVLERASGWQVVDARVEFANTADTAAFNELAGQLGAAAEELTALEQRAEAMNAEYERTRPRY